ncbi:MAG: NTP transferase domain-containing protein [bacterium]
MQDLAWLVLAAGRGKRMKSSVPKVRHKLAGKPILNHVLDSLTSLEVKRKIVVLGYKEKAVREILSPDIEVVIQPTQEGTAHAVRQAEISLADFEGDCLVLSGDLPLLTAQTIEGFISFHRERKNVASLLVAPIEDTNESPLIYCFQATFLFWALGEVKPHSEDEEEDLNDCIAILKDRGHQVETVVVSDPTEAIDINTRVDLAKAEGILKSRTINRLMVGGVTIIDPDSVFIDATVTIEPDTVIYPFTTILGKTKIEKDCVIGPQVFLLNAEVGAGATIYTSFISDAKVKPGANIGPFAHISNQPQ